MGESVGNNIKVELQNCSTLPIEWGQICISGVSLVEHLSMSDFPFPSSENSKCPRFGKCQVPFLIFSHIMDKAGGKFSLLQYN